jgi:hypothetical protein
VRYGDVRYGTARAMAGVDTHGVQAEHQAIQSKHDAILFVWKLHNIVTADGAPRRTHGAVRTAPYACMAPHARRRTHAWRRTHGAVRMHSVARRHGAARVKRRLIRPVCTTRPRAALAAVSCRQTRATVREELHRYRSSCIGKRRIQNRSCTAAITSCLDAADTSLLRH